MAKYNYSKMKKEAGQPCVGIFWIRNTGQTIDFPKPLNTIHGVSNFFDSPDTHYNMWNRVRTTFPEFAGKEYEEVPRGRVIFDGNSQRFKVYVPSDLVNTIIKNNIISGFGLPVAKVDFIGDSHYITPPKPEDVDNEADNF